MEALSPTLGLPVLKRWEWKCSTQTRHVAPSLMGNGAPEVLSLNLPRRHLCSFQAVVSRMESCIQQYFRAHIAQDNHGALESCRVRRHIHQRVKCILFSREMYRDLLT